MKLVTFVLCVLVLGAHTLLVLGDCDMGGGKKLKTGETFQTPGKCILSTCEANGSLTGKGCPSLASLKPCKLTEDVSEPYPKCCPHFDC